MALTAQKVVQQRIDPFYNYTQAYGSAASVVYYPGGLVCLNSSGYLTKVTAATGLNVLGIIGPQPDKVLATSYTAAGTNGATTMYVQFGEFKFVNSGTAACTIANIGDQVFAEDDETVSGTSQSSSLSAMGIMTGLDADGGVWVRVGATSIT